MKCQNATKPVVMAAWAELASGPGWANHPLWVLVRYADGRYDLKCMQPEDHSPTVAALYAIGANVHQQLTAEATRWLEDTWRVR